MVQEPEAIKEFADLYEREYGVRLPPDEAKFKAEKLMKVFRRVFFHENQNGEIKDVI